jgi:hypothetical protein
VRTQASSTEPGSKTSLKEKRTQERKEGCFKKIREGEREKKKGREGG